MRSFNQIGRLPAPTDNVAIAVRRLEAGTAFDFDGKTLVLSHTVLEGHRFAVVPIEKGEYLYSWKMPFGMASERIETGDYVCNVGVLEALRGRDIDFELPERANFIDEIPSFTFNADRFEPAEQIHSAANQYYFEGFDKGRRGVGTRNYIAILAASSWASGLVRRLAAECSDFTESLPNIDGVVPIAHTEGDDEKQFNKELVLRTLAGFCVHPNIGAVLMVDAPGSSITCDGLLEYLRSNDYPIDDVLHAGFSMQGDVESVLAEGKNIVVSWLSKVNRAERSRQSVRHLNIALQCGGSDAFSGVSGNPLAAWVAREVIKEGGRANLAETDELIGAESYVLQRVRNLETAERFLAVKDRFVEVAERHGSSAAGNPSGGNKYRGLYNIYLKSLGAAMKRNPDVRLDYVIEYGETMTEPGYYFMDSPGNDLESIAGQVASGGNVIFFVTGNGSITNFPFVPTIKIVTTTPRYELLAEDMDVNAGAYLDGTSMDELGADTLGLTLRVASGEKSAGERAGHAQVQLWRNWRLASGESRPTDPGSHLLAGNPLLAASSGAPGPDVPDLSLVPPQVALVLPTSLCSAQIARMAAERLDASGKASVLGVSRFVSLVHTEGCGVSSGPAEDLFIRTMTGYLSHPAIKYAFLLEHGCEKTHNDYFSRYMARHGMDTERFGWASIQRDGGIENVLALIDAWFGEKVGEKNAQHPRIMNIGLLIDAAPANGAVDTLASAVRAVVDAGGSVVAANTNAAASLHEHLALKNAKPTLNYGQAPGRAGYHVMAVPTSHVQETLAGLGATGVDAILVVSERAAIDGHPFIPVVHAALSARSDIDISIEDGTHVLLQRIRAAAAGEYVPLCDRYGLVDFQMSRGWQGISL